MPIKPGKNETQDEWMNRCVPEMIGTGPDKRPQVQAVAICMDMWRNKDKPKKFFVKDISPPKPGVESNDAWMERCVLYYAVDSDKPKTADEAVKTCAELWGNAS